MLPRKTKYSTWYGTIISSRTRNESGQYGCPKDMSDSPAGHGSNRSSSIPTGHMTTRDHRPFSRSRIMQLTSIYRAIHRATCVRTHQRKSFTRNREVIFREPGSHFPGTGKSFSGNLEVIFREPGSCFRGTGKFIPGNREITLWEPLSGGTQYNQFAR